MHFNWHSSANRHRTAILLKGNRMDVLDFEKQEINNYTSDFIWPIEAELKAFLSNKWHDPKIAYKSHKFLIECLKLSE